jgi:hypothetical protein
MNDTKQTVIVEHSPQGAIVKLLGHFARVVIEPHCNHLPIWDGVIKPVVEQFVIEQGVPSEPISPVDLARRAVLLKPNPRGRRRVRP